MIVVQILITIILCVAATAWLADDDSLTTKGWLARSGIACTAIISLSAWLPTT